MSAPDSDERLLRLEAYDANSEYLGAADAVATLCDLLRHLRDNVPEVADVYDEELWAMVEKSVSAVPAARVSQLERTRRLRLLSKVIGTESNDDELARRFRSIRDHGVDVQSSLISSQQELSSSATVH